jgi:hypothetical protein
MPTHFRGLIFFLLNLKLGERVNLRKIYLRESKPERNSPFLWRKSRVHTSTVVWDPNKVESPSLAAVQGRNTETATLALALTPPRSTPGCPARKKEQNCLAFQEPKFLPWLWISTRPEIGVCACKTHPQTVHVCTVLSKRETPPKKMLNCSIFHRQTVHVFTRAHTDNGILEFHNTYIYM